MSDYVPTDWVDNVTLVDATRMDHLEAGVDQAVAGNPPVVVNGSWLTAVGGAMVWAPAEVIGTQIAVTAADSDFPWTGGNSHGVFVATNAGGGSLRSYGAGPRDGSRLVIRNGSTACTLRHNVAGGTGLKLFLAGAVDLVLGTNHTVEFVQNGTFWFQVAQVPATPAAAGARIDYENAWAAGTPYQAGDVVRYNNVDYLSVNDSTGQTPPAATIQTAIPVALVDAKGDLVAASAADVVGRLAVGTDGQVLTADAAQTLGIKWGAPPASAPALVTALPGSPVDGQEVILVDSLTAPTFSWHLKYVAAKASNKWLFVGGAPKFAEVVTDEGSTSDTYAALTTAGPSIALPVAGDYIVAIGCFSYNVTSGEGGLMSYDIGGTVAVDADMFNAVATSSGSGVSWTDGSRPRKKTGLTAVTLTAKYKRKTAGGTTQFKNRWMQVEPIAVGG